MWDDVKRAAVVAGQAIVAAGEKAAGAISSLKWPMIGLLAVVLGIGGFGLYRRVSGR